MENITKKISLVKIHAFPKIFHIGERFIENLFKGPVEISEKLDGSQFNFGINSDDELVMRSKGEDLTYSEVPKMFTLAQEQVLRIEKILRAKNLIDIYFYCEFLSKPRHNIMKYERVPKNNLYLFGVLRGEMFVSDTEELKIYADLIEVESVNVIFQGEITDIKELEKLLDNNSILGKEKIEGIVVKNYKEPSIVGSMIIPMSMGKYVREEFKERHATEWGSKFTSKGRLELFLSSFKTEARWLKGIQHLKEKNELENSPKDIGKLMTEIKRDVIEEEKENIKKELFKIYKGDIERISIRGFAEFYKEQLLKSTIKNENK